LGPIGSAVLTFIGYKQTDRQTDRQAKFIYRWPDKFSLVIIPESSSIDILVVLLTAELVSAV